MAAIDLNTVRQTIEERLQTELNDVPIIPVIFNNMPFESISEDTFVQCLTSFGSGRYLANGVNVVAGLVLINIFTKEGVGIGSNYVIGKRIRDLYNKITVSDPSPQGKFQTQLRITFEVYEEL